MTGAGVTLGGRSCDERTLASLVLVLTVVGAGSLPVEAQALPKVVGQLPQRDVLQNLPEGLRGRSATWRYAPLTLKLRLRPSASRKTATGTCPT